MAQVQSWGTLVCVPPHGIMAAFNPDDRRGIAKTEAKTEADNDSSEPLAKRFKQIDINDDDQANHFFDMKLHRRIVAIEASLEGIQQLRKEKCHRNTCQRWAACGYKHCCLPCSRSNGSRHSKRCPLQHWIPKVGDKRKFDASR